MSSFDDDVREALKRVDPPEGFAGRVLARVRECESGSSDLPAPRAALVARVRTTAWRWMAVAAAVVVAVTVGLSMYLEHLQRSEGERAKQEVLFALRITS